MFGDGAADLNDGGLLEGIGPDDGSAHLACDGDDGDGVHLGVGQTGNEIGRPGSTGGHAKAHFACGACVTLGCKATPLLVAGQNGANAVGIFG